MPTSPRMPWSLIVRRGYVAMGFALSFAGLAVAAQPQTQAAVKRVAEHVEGHKAEAKTFETVLVWQGRDVDGDGAPDFANPTGAAPRALDDFGSGAFGARRDGGGRRHEGVDYAATVGQVVRAPISGYVTKIGYAYGDDAGLRFVEITNPAIGYVARAFYIDPTVTVGQAVRLGSQIGRAVSLQSHYPGITDHVHLEVMNPARARIDANRVIVAKLTTREVRG